MSFSRAVREIAPLPASKLQQQQQPAADAAAASPSPQRSTSAKRRSLPQAAAASSSPSSSAAVAVEVDAKYTALFAAQQVVAASALSLQFPDRFADCVTDSAVIVVDGKQAFKGKAGASEYASTSASSRTLMHLSQPVLALSSSEPLVKSLLDPLQQQAFDALMKQQAACSGAFVLSVCPFVLFDAGAIVAQGRLHDVLQVDAPSRNAATIAFRHVVTTWSQQQRTLAKKTRRPLPLATAVGAEGTASAVQSEPIPAAVLAADDKQDGEEERADA